MKRKIIFILLGFIAILTSCSSIGIPIYRNVTVNGKTVRKRVILYAIEEYDANGNLIHYKASYGVEWWREYDAYGNEIHYKASNGYEEWHEYEFWDNDKIKKVYTYISD